MKVWMVYGIFHDFEREDIRRDVECLTVFDSYEKAFEEFKLSVIDSAKDVGFCFDERIGNLTEEELFTDESDNHGEGEIYIRYKKHGNDIIWTIDCDDKYFYFNNQHLNMPYVWLVEKEVY